MYQRNAGLPDEVASAVMNLVYTYQMAPDDIYDAVQYGIGPKVSPMKYLDMYFREYPWQLEKFAEYVDKYDFYVRIDKVYQEYRNAVEEAKNAVTPYDKGVAVGRAWGIAYTLSMFNYSTEGIEIQATKGGKTP